MSYKFDCFCLKTDNNIHYLYEIENENDYLKIRDDIICPECKTAHLCRVKNNGKTYLRSIKSTPHAKVNGEDCLYNYPIASTTTVKKYVSALVNDNKINSLLDSVIRKMYFGPSKVKANDLENKSINNENPFIISKERKNKIVKERFLHCSIKNWGPNVLPNTFYIVYGKVYVKMTTTYLYFYIFDQMTKRKHLIASVKNVFKDEDLTGCYYLAAIAQCKKICTKKRIYYNMELFSFNTKTICLVKV